MAVLSKRDVDILEERGYWQASSSLHRQLHRLAQKKLPLRIGLIKHAHQAIFKVANQPSIAGKYRQHNGPELERIDGSILKMTGWQMVPNAMAELDFELREVAKNLKFPKTEKEYRNIIEIAARLSHKLTCIHPFENGNGRASRLLLNAILIRAGLSEVAVKKEKPIYLRAMRQADDGDFNMLENIISDGLIENKKMQYKIQIRKQAESVKIKGRHNRLKKKK